MATYTPNYNLKKPAEDDFYSVQDFNDNADIIDRGLAAKATKVLNGVANNFVTLDARGELIDSGKSAADFVGKEDMTIFFDCNGRDDNIRLVRLVSELTANRNTAEIIVTGVMGGDIKAYGDGTEDNPFAFLAFGENNTTADEGFIHLDFTDAQLPAFSYTVAGGVASDSFICPLRFYANKVNYLLEGLNFEVANSDDGLNVSGIYRNPCVDYTPGDLRLTRLRIKVNGSNLPSYSIRLGASSGNVYLNECSVIATGYDMSGIYALQDTNLYINSSYLTSSHYTVRVDAGSVAYIDNSYIYSVNLDETISNINVAGIISLNGRCVINNSYCEAYSTYRNYISGLVVQRNLAQETVIADLEQDYALLLMNNCYVKTHSSTHTYMGTTRLCCGIDFAGDNLNKSSVRYSSYINNTHIYSYGSEHTLGAYCENGSMHLDNCLCFAMGPYLANGVRNLGYGDVFINNCHCEGISFNTSSTAVGTAGFWLQGNRTGYKNRTVAIGSSFAAYSPISSASQSQTAGFYAIGSSSVAAVVIFGCVFSYASFTDDIYGTLTEKYNVLLGTGSGDIPNYHVQGNIFNKSTIHIGPSDVSSTTASASGYMPTRANKFSF